MSTEHAQASTYRVQLRQPLVLLAMHVGRVCAQRRRAVTAGEIQEMLACSPATARRFLAAYRLAYPDIVELQNHEARQDAAAETLDPELFNALTGVIDRAWGLPTAAEDPGIEAARAAAARADAFDNIDPDYPE